MPINYLSLALKLAPYVVIAALIGAVLWFRGEAIDEAAKRSTAEAQLATAVSANKEQAETITRLTALREQNDKLLLDFTTKLSEFTQATEETQASIRGLETTNAEVKDYLSVAIPADLRGVLNRPDRR